MSHLAVSEKHNQLIQYVISAQSKTFIQVQRLSLCQNQNVEQSATISQFGLHIPGRERIDSRANCFKAFEILMTTQKLPASRHTCTKVGVQVILLIMALAASY